MKRDWLTNFQLCFFISLGIAFGLTGCAREESRPPAVDVKVEHLPAARAFRVTYETSFNARALVFNRSQIPFRVRRWMPFAGRAELQSRGGREVLIANAPTQVFQIMVPEQAIELAGDYPPVTAFSDGSLVLYSGHLDVTPISCVEVCTDDDIRSKAKTPAPVRLTLVPGTGERVVAGGQPSSSSLTLSPPSEGAFAYFGNLPLHARGDYSVVIDPQMPGWVLAEFDRYFPQVLDLNARKLGRSLPSPTVVMMPYREVATTISSTYSGAVVGNQMLLTLYGDHWKARSNSAREDFLKLMAHESFHFWNASMFHSVDSPGGAWLHEGSADAFAYLALYELGIVQGSRLTELQGEALNRCIVGLSGTDLPSSDRSSRSMRNYYDCGAIVQQLVNRAARRNGSDLWKTWSKLFDRAESRDRFYTHQDFFEIADNETKGSSVLRSVESLVSGSVKGTDVSGNSMVESHFMISFGQVGVALVADDRRWPDWYQRLVGERALAAAVEADCASEGRFVGLSSKARLVGGPGCRHLKEEREVYSLGRYSLWDDGVTLYDLIRNRCLQGTATFEIRGSDLELTCPQLPRRPDFLRFQDVEAFK